MWWTKSTPNHEFQACPDHSILAPTDAHWLVLALLLLLWRAPELFQSRETHLHSSFIAIHVKGGFSHSARSCHQTMRSCSRFTDITKVWIICLLRTLVIGHASSLLSITRWWCEAQLRAMCVARSGKMMGREHELEGNAVQPCQHQGMHKRFSDQFRRLTTTLPMNLTF